MKTSRVAQSLIGVMPFVCVAASVGIVTQQSIRRERLTRELAASRREYARLEAQYNRLRPSSSSHASAVQSAETHPHHDNDGD